MEKTPREPISASDLSTNWMNKPQAEIFAALDEVSVADYWSIGDFKAVFRNRDMISMYVEHRKTIIGYYLFERHDRYYNINRMVVLPSYRRCKVGSYMMDSIKNRLLRSSATDYVIANVRESDLGCQLFMKANGFTAIGIIRGYFTYEDSYLMKWPIYGKVEFKVV